VENKCSRNLEEESLSDLLNDSGSEVGTNLESNFALPDSSDSNRVAQSIAMKYILVVESQCCMADPEYSPMNKYVQNIPHTANQDLIPTSEINASYSPLQMFGVFVNDERLENIKLETNQYTKQQIAPEVKKKMYFKIGNLQVFQRSKFSGHNTIHKPGSGR
jgi:hypothetical protein